MSGKKSPQTIKVFVFRPDRKPSFGERIGVYWEDDMRFYTGEVTDSDVRVASTDQDGKLIVNYDDGETETLNLDEEIWDFPNDPMRYRNDSQRGSASNGNSGSDSDAGESRVEDKKDRESEEKHNKERNVCNGQASASKQVGSKHKRRKPKKTQEVQKIQKSQKAPATRRAPRTERVKRAREVQEPETRQNMEDVRNVKDMQNQRPIENPGHPQNREDANNAEHIQEHRDTRNTSPLLMKQLLPVKRYTRILQLKKRGNKNKDSILEMPFDS